MSNNKTDKLFERIAKTYADLHGQVLQRDAAALNAQNIRYVTPRLDGTVWELTKKKKKRKFSAAIAAIAAAACLILTVTALSGVWNKRGGLLSESSESPESEDSDFFDKEDGFISMTFNLGANYHVSSADFDNGKSIYLIDNVSRDNIVMILERTDEDYTEYQKLREFYVGGTTAYGIYRADYSLLAFEKDSIYYTLTCKYDIYTLLDFAEIIIYSDN